MVTLIGDGGFGTNPSVLATAKEQNIPVKEVPYELPEGEMVCSCCGGKLHKIGEDVSQRLVFRPAAFEIEEEHVSTYSCRECQHVIRAPHPKPLFEGSIATEPLLAGIMNAKFVNAAPYDRIDRKSVV